jgi:DNA-directed RNA polymerase specialized sigma subunit
MKQTNERLCALAQKGDAAALNSLIENNKSFIGKVANDLFRSMNLAQAGLNLDTDDLKQSGQVHSVMRLFFRRTACLRWGDALLRKCNNPL